MTTETKRSNIDLPADVMEQLNEIVPRGMRNAILASLLEAYIKTYHEQGPMTEVCVRAGRFTLALDKLEQRHG